MAAKRKANTKKDLEEKIAKLEEKLTKLSKQLDSPSVSPSNEAPKPAKVKPAETKPAETAKPKPTLPKGSAPKPAPKPAETTSQPPVTVQAALEDAYMNAAMTDFHQYRAKVTGYTPAPNRYFVRNTAPVGTVPTKNWNDQKATVTGYTQPSNQYFATRARLAYHPSDKRFGTFSGVSMTVDGLTIQTKPKEAPKLTPQEAEKLAKESYVSEMKAKGMGSLPKGF